MPSKLGIPAGIRGPTKPPAMAKPQGFNPGRSPIVAKRAANNAAKPRMGLKNTVTDNDPMARASDANYP
jgi:hypothetical protein